jgi:maleylacetoacetate isomerase
MKLYTSYRSDAAYRVRIALTFKGLPHESEYFDVDDRDGLIHDPDYREINPQGVVPTLGEGYRRYRQSIAIMEYLEECYPTPPILPGSSRDRERIRSLSQLIVSDIAPLTGPRALAYLKTSLGLDEEGCKSWIWYWSEQGLAALESLLKDNPATTNYCHGDLPTMADICLVSQVHGFEQHGWRLETFPTIERIYRTCMELDAFRTTAPEFQPDNPSA